MTANRQTGQVRPKRCPTCRQPTLTGLEDGVGPSTATVDALALTLEGELLALAAGHATYGRAPGFELGKRDVWRIQHLPPQPPGGYTVHAAHKCGINPFPHYPMLKKPAKTELERPPF